MAGAPSSCFSLVFNCLLFSMHPPPPPPPPSPALPTPLAFIPLPSSSSVHPSLSLPGACLSGSVPVCLFADDSTWSRCDAQQLLLCSITLPCHLPRSALAASLPPSLCLPSNKCLCNALIYVPFLSCFFCFVFLAACRHAIAQLLIGDVSFEFVCLFGFFFFLYLL